MELRQLRYFVKTAELLNFSEAARELNVAQSTLSQQVRQLENELNIRLFDRNSHEIILTEAAREILPFALKTIKDADNCVSKIQDLSGLKTGTLNIGVTYSFSPILTETLLQFTKSYPNVKLNVFYRPMSELMDMLTSHSVDFVLAFRPSKRIADIESHVLFDNHLAVIIRESHPLASRDKISLSDIRNYKLALPSKGLQARNAFDDYLGAYADSFDIRIELNEVNILLELIRNSDMVTILAEATVYNRSGVKAVPLDLPVNEMEGCVHMLKDSYRKHSAIEFIHMLKDSEAVIARNHHWFL